MISENEGRDFSSDLSSVNPTAYNMFLLKTHKDQTRKTFRTEPSSVLRDVKAFLPKLADANKSLEGLVGAGQGDSVDIECLDNCDGPVINMDIALMEQSGTESSDNETDSDGELLQGEITEENMKLTRHVRGKQPHIEVVEPVCDEVDTVAKTDQATVNDDT